MILHKNINIFAILFYYRLTKCIWYDPQNWNLFNLCYCDMFHQIFLK